MNYYEHHIGDYDEATSHLTACEDGIYCRLIRKYYATERPLIASVPKLQRLVRAKTREEKQAVTDMLAEFFHLKDDGWHQNTCDEVISDYIAGEPEREAKRANEDTRLKRHRDERARLFKVLTDAGQHAPWNVPMAELRELVKRVSATAAETFVPPLQETETATPVTATQTPDTRHQAPDTIPNTKNQERAPTAATAIARALEGKNPENPPNGHAATPAGTVCSAMRNAGLAATNPGDPRLLALLAQGATEAEFVGVAAEAAGKGKGWAWVLKVVEARREEASRITLADQVDDGSAAAQEAIRLTAERASEEEAHRMAAMSPESHAARKRVMSMIGGLSAKLTGKTE